MSQPAERRRTLAQQFLFEIDVTNKLPGRTFDYELTQVDNEGHTRFAMRAWYGMGLENISFGGPLNVVNSSVRNLKRLLQYCWGGGLGSGYGKIVWQHHWRSSRDDSV